MADSIDGQRSSDLAVELSPLAGHGIPERDRTKLESWFALPQAERGISVRELLHVYHSNKDWIEEKSWRCKACGRRAERMYGPCLNCGGTEGRIQMRNLYEVNDKIIMPACEATRTSYVEYLARDRNVPGGLQVNTFVSHWWGEEFAKFVASLERFAAVRCTDATPRYPAALVAAATFIVLPYITARAFDAMVSTNESTDLSFSQG